MSTQRKLLVVLLFVAAVLATLLVLVSSSRERVPLADPMREQERPPPPPRPSEPTESSEARSAMPVADPPASARVARSEDVPATPVKIFGRIGDERGAALAKTEVAVYDSRGEKHTPEVLRADWYECTIHERGRALVVASHEEHCPIEVPFEILEPDTERHIDLVLPARPELRIHVRDLQGKPLPRFAKGQPLRAKLHALASFEDMPAQLSGQMAMLAASETPELQLGWGEFEPESLQTALGARAGMYFPGAAREMTRPRGDRQRRRAQPGRTPRQIGWDPAKSDEESFDAAVAQVRVQYKRRLETEPRIEEDDPARLFLAALGYIGEDGTPIEGESPERDLVGTLRLVRPLPLRISLLAGQRLLESHDPLPWTADLLFKIDFERLAESYVHTYLFASDAKTGARLPYTRVNLHVEPLPGGPEDSPNASRRMSASYAGREASAELGAPKGWRYPDGEVTTDLDGRADFQAALAGWCRLTLTADGHVPLTKWVFIERTPECYLGFFELAPLSTSKLSVVDPAGAAVSAAFDVRPLLHAKDSEGMLKTWNFTSDPGGELALKDVGRQHLLLRSSDRLWALTPVVLDNNMGIVDGTPVHVRPAQHVLLHLPASLPWNSIVHVGQGLGVPVYEEAFSGKTLIDLWVGDGTYTVRVWAGLTTLLTAKFTLAGEPQLVELAP